MLVRAWRAPWIRVLWLLGTQPHGSVENVGMQTIGRRWWPPETAIAAQEVSVWTEVWLLGVHVVLLSGLEKAPLLVGGCSSYQDPRLDKQVGLDFKPTCPSVRRTWPVAQGGFIGWSDPNMQAVWVKCFEPSPH